MSPARRGRDEPWLAAEGLAPELGRAWARHWPGWFGPGRTGLPRAPERKSLALVETPIGRVVAKRARPVGWKLPLVGIGARASRSERAFQLGRALLARGLATPEPLAVLGRPGEDVLVTRYVEGVGPWELLPRLGPPSRFLALLAGALARLHAADFRHRDLKASNLLFAGTDAESALFWTDLDGLRRAPQPDARTRARDLARLAASFSSVEARAAGVRAEHWPALVARYLELYQRGPVSPDEHAAFLGRTRVHCERAIRRRLARGEAVS